MGIFGGFADDRVEVDPGIRLHVRHGGSGPPLLLLHGHPRTHATWHRVAESLAEDHSVVCPDLRGYGRSSKPPTTADHAPYSKRAMAADCAALVRSLGHERFVVVGHDRGGYVAQRLALDHAPPVTALVVLDVVPIGEALRRCDARFAERWWHWFFLSRPAPLPERVIDADPDGWYGRGSSTWSATRALALEPEARADFRRAIHDPATVHAMWEDYRAGLTVDRAADEADRAAGRRIACPTLVLWAEHDDLPELYGDVLAVWRQWAREVDGHGLDCGHHIAEESPDDLVSELRAFLAGLAESTDLPDLADREP